ncbi:hypothetical protein GCM10009558_005300 [Virgisporangium aurantiacum]
MLVGPRRLRLLAFATILLFVIPQPACSSDSTGNLGGEPERTNAPDGLGVAASPPGSPDGAAPVAGNCNAIGTGNSVSCSFPASNAVISVQDTTVRAVWFNGSPSQLPTPPTFSSLGYPCGDWMDWLRGRTDMYFDGPEIDITLQGDSVGSVALTNVNMTVLRRSAQSTSGTWISCYYGGGTNAPFRIEVNTRTNKSTVANYDEDHNLGPERPMPPAFLSPDGNASVAGNVGVKSLDGYLYEGYITFVGVVNGKPWNHTVGSDDRPLRWISSTSYGGTDASYMWNRKTRKWTLGHTPYQE